MDFRVFTFAPQIGGGFQEELIMATAAIGQDRIVGGMHYQSDVIASRTLAQILLASLSADPKFQADLEAVRP